MGFLTLTRREWYRFNSDKEGRTIPTLRLNGDARGAIKANLDMGKAIEKAGQEADKTEKRLTKMERAARSIKEANDPQQRYNRRLKETAQLAARGKISIDDAQKAAQRYAKAAQRAGQSGKKAFGETAIASVQSLATRLAGGGGVLAAVNQINQAYEIWIKNIREVSDESKKAQDEIIAFAALQEGGTKATRVQRASDLATRFGISSRGEAFNTVQALQSARGGDFEAGLRIAETVFAAKQVGIPVEFGRELEVLGASQGQRPGQALRRAFVAGQESSRSPREIAKAAPSFKFFEDKDFGFAAAAVLAGSVSEEQIKTILKQSGAALSATGSAQSKFEELGLGKATQQQRLSKLVSLGIDTPEELSQFGFTEQRQIEGLAALVPNAKEINRIESVIDTKAVPGLFLKERSAVEAELPNQKLSRQISILKSGFRDELAFGPEAKQALQQEVSERLRGQAFKKLGINSVFNPVPFAGPGFGVNDAIDEEGRATLFSQLVLPADVQLRVIEEMDRLRASLDRNSEAQETNNGRQPITTRAE